MFQKIFRQVPDNSQRRLQLVGHGVGEIPPPLLQGLLAVIDFSKGPDYLPCAGSGQGQPRQIDDPHGFHGLLPGPALHADLQIGKGISRHSQLKLIPGPVS